MEEGRDVSCPYTEPTGWLNKLHPGEKITDFEGGGFRSVGAMRTIIADTCSEIAPDGAGSGLLGVGSTHCVSPFEDGAFGFEDERKNFAGTHEVGQLAEKRPFFV